MRINKLVQLVSQSIRRNRRDFLLSSIGIVVGISTLLFFTALGSGIKQVVLERIFVVRQLEVVKKTFDVAGMRTEGLFGGKSLDDKTVERFAGVDGVAEVYPKMKLTFPASLRGGKSILGRDMVAELIADGIPPRLVDEELPGKLEFRDWGQELSCSEAADCPGGHSCSAGVCEPKACSGENDPVCGGKSYCHEASGQCQMPIPVIASPKMLEIYNGSFQTAMGGARGVLSKLPKLSEDALVGFRFDGVFGKSFIGSAARGKRVTYRMEFVGFSDKAIDLGATIPIGYVQRLNQRFGNQDDNGEYHSIVVETESNEVVPRVAKRIEEMGFALSDEYEDAQRAGLLIMLLTLVFNFISLIILTISAVNIMHTFLMVILERRQELGLMRALGATKGDIRKLVISEATVLGIFGGLAGLVLGGLVIKLIDYLFATQVGEFPFKPESLFVVEAWMMLGAVGVAVVFCWLGSLIPAFQASHVDPARTLSGH
ncbi:FtsX-like permease family protein [Persicimonas caeni]|uniref:FtsX-like permease family protein n=1 Tax=Persicimonas caeni TaxID=2292766 RepID=A0A4Y6PWY7_PERCE|nr:FtsX-like permease family protein [Persicimonas caeni]QDG52750.1 FtsX-like permease family protein [Persicimonas caeni]QED33972.1 FtsX-like permease family protein [Persicimonas caeni]